MLISKNRKKVLEQLGLTVVQSKVYIANIDIGHATAKQISKVANIAREEVYRVIPSLEAMGLIKKHIAKPALFEPTPLQEALTYLINHRKQETEKITDDANNLLNELKNAIEVTHQYEEKEELVLISNHEAMHRRWVSETKRARHTMDGTINWDSLKEDLPKLTDYCLRLIERGAKLRSVIDEPKEIPKFPLATQRLLENPGYQFRYVSKPPKCRVAIFDDERCFAFVSTTVYVEQSPSIWTDNPILVRLMKEYFNNLWESGKEVNFKKLFSEQKKHEKD